MSHSPFETWLFSDEPRSAQEAAELRQHLASCDRCQTLQAGWAQVQRDLTQPPLAAPRPGFTGRWEARMALDSRKRARRQSGVLLGGIALGIVVGLALLAWLGLPQPLRLPSLAGMVSSGVQWITNTTVIFYVGRQILGSLTGPIVPAVIVGWGGALTAAAVGLCGGWLLVIYQLNWNYAQKGAQR